MKPRLFAGIELDDATRAACAAAAERLRATGFSARYEDPNKLHVTLAFLGNVEAARVDEVAAATREAVAFCRPFDVTFDKIGAFPHERKPRIVYAGAREQGAAFRDAAAAIRNAYRERGFDFKDDAVAHVTIARVRDPARPLPLLDLEPARLRVGAIALFQSLPDKEKNTSRYEVLLRAYFLT